MNAGPVLKCMCCRPCQQIADSGPVTIMGVPEAAFEYVKGQSHIFANSELDQPSIREFCAKCGTHLVPVAPSAPGVTLVKVGSLDYPSVFGLPQFAVQMAASEPYYTAPTGVPQIEGWPRR